MRLLALAAAALIATGVAAAPADSQPPRHGHGWHHGGRHGYHNWRGRRCTWVWRHHHRVRRCW